MDIDRKMLKEIFRIPSLSGDESKMANYIKGKLVSLGISYEEDEKGNVFKFTGKKPFLNAHMDTVQDLDDFYLASLITIKEDCILDGLGVIGGDDKCGIYIILRMLEKGHDINFAFTVSEEIGTIGSGFLADTKAKELKECLYGLTLDRKGNTDIICFDNSYGTIEFENALEFVGKEFGYKPAMGVLSDADEFNKFMSCANLSVGYYRQHTKKEFVILEDLAKAEKYVESILKEVQRKFAIPEPKYTKVCGYPGVYGRGGYYDSYYDEFDAEHSIKTKDWAKEIDNFIDDEDDYYEKIEKEFLSSSCECCGEEADLFFVKTLQGFYCPKCMIDIAEELVEQIELNVL